MRPVTFDSYHDKYEAIRLERSGGVLEMTLHTDGRSLVFDRTIHEELDFADIAADGAPAASACADSLRPFLRDHLARFQPVTHSAEGTAP